MRLNNLQKATLLFCKTPAGYQNNVVKAKIAEIWLKIGNLYILHFFLLNV